MSIVIEDPVCQLYPTSLAFLLTPPTITPVPELCPKHHSMHDRAKLVRVVGRTWLGQLNYTHQVLGDDDEIVINYSYQLIKY